jgi:triacylglycerol lipase
MKTNPVVLLAGIWDPPVRLGPLSAYLRERGRDTHTFEYAPRNGDAGLGRLALQVADYIDKTFPRGDRIDLVGFSMGGLIARCYVQQLAEPGRVERLVTISTPHRGTWTAYCLRRPGVRQMRPGSDFLRDLEAGREALRGIRFTSVWTPLDLMIVPASSSVVPEARSVRVVVPIHRMMVRDRQVMRLVEEGLSGLATYT